MDHGGLLSPVGPVSPACNWLQSLLGWGESPSSGVGQESCWGGVHRRVLQGDELVLLLSWPLSVVSQGPRRMASQCLEGWGSGQGLKCAPSWIFY